MSRCFLVASLIRSSEHLLSCSLSLLMHVFKRDGTIGLSLPVLHQNRGTDSPHGVLCRSLMSDGLLGPSCMLYVYRPCNLNLKVYGFTSAVAT